MLEVYLVCRNVFVSNNLHETSDGEIAVDLSVMKEKNVVYKNVEHIEYS